MDRQEPETAVPELDWGPDYTLVTLILCVIFMPLMYILFSHYLHPWMTVWWFLISIGLSFGLFFLGRGIQSWWAARLGFEKPVYDRDKSAGSHIRITKTLLPFFIALAVGAGFYFLAHGIREWYYAQIPHETEARIRDNAYEYLCAAYGFLVPYLSALLWFIPEEQLLPYDSLTARFLPPVALFLIPMILLSQPFLPSLFYGGTAAILSLIRWLRVRSYLKTVERVKRETAFRDHKDRFE